MNADLCNGVHEQSAPFKRNKNRKKQLVFEQQTSDGNISAELTECNIERIFALIGQLVAWKYENSDHLLAGMCAVRPKYIVWN